MAIRFAHENDFVDFKHTVSKCLGGREIRKIDKSNLTLAAVMILLMNKDGSPCILLTRRTDKVRTHKGEVSLPGGAFDMGDNDLLATALRETDEEVGIEPDDIELTGQFDDFVSIHGFHVSTYVGSIPYPYSYTINKDEIDDHFEVPLDLFIEGRYSKVESVEYKGNNYNIYHYYYNEFDIWGMTARILTDFGAELSHHFTPSEKAGN